MNIIKNYGNYCYSDESPSGEKLNGFAVYYWDANIGGWAYLVTMQDEFQASFYAKRRQASYEEWMK